MRTDIWDNYGIKVERVPYERLKGVRYKITVGEEWVYLTGQEFKIFLTETLIKAQARKREGR
ncbi:unnamed protein product [marine sediment metagenome]|uniref:Uncharacterized protein n=1 Tax=marine sediment metagenome TaxID=412755 RepID=X1HMS2_9ZZZZ